MHTQIYLYMVVALETHLWYAGIDPIEVLRRCLCWHMGNYLVLEIEPRPLSLKKTVTPMFWILSSTLLLYIGLYIPNYLPLLFHKNKIIIFLGLIIYIQMFNISWIFGVELIKQTPHKLIFKRCHFSSRVSKPIYDMAHIIWLI